MELTFRKAALHCCIIARQFMFYYIIHLQKGYTPVHLACRYGYLDIVEELISRGANVNAARPVRILAT